MELEDGIIDIMLKLREKHTNNRKSMNDITGSILIFNVFRKIV